MDHIDSCVIGAGVVGLAIGRLLAIGGREVYVLDREADFGQGVSSRNSEVIHAGIYYPRDSLKARFCVAGKGQLYQYCQERNVGHRRCGKLIVATERAEESVLDDIFAKAQANEVNDLTFLTAAQVKRLEPDVRATAALMSPSTGIVSSHELMAAYLADIENSGGAFVGNTRVLRVEQERGCFVVSCDAGGESYQFSANFLVNAAGLAAQSVAAGFTFLDPGTVPPLYLCKGNYFSLSGSNPFKHLIYPVPEKRGAGLGVHATLDLGGQVKFGPDVEYIQEEDYSVNVARLSDYYDAVRRYFPGLRDGDLQPAYVGIRPKLQGPQDSPKDFVIQGPGDHGVDALVQLYGIESPGLTSSMAIADHVVTLLLDQT